MEKNSERFTADSTFPKDAELRASEVKITDHGRLQLVMKDEVSGWYMSLSIDGGGWSGGGETDSSAWEL